MVERHNHGSTDSNRKDSIDQNQNRSSFGMTRRSLLGSIGVGATAGITGFPSVSAQTGTTIADRRDSFVQDMAAATPSDVNPYSKEFYYAGCRFETGDTAGGQDLLDINAAVNGLFDVWGSIDIYLRYKDDYTASHVDEVRRKTTERDYPTDIDQGTTNQQLSKATAGYLAAQTWPSEVVDGTWDACETKIFDLIDARSQRGNYEHDSPSYITFYLGCMASLADHAEDPEMRQRAKMQFEWHLTDVLSQWQDGVWAAMSTRLKYPHSNYKCPQAGDIVTWLLFGGPAPDVPVGEYGWGEQHYVVPIALSSLDLPGMLQKINQDRSFPYTHRERLGNLDTGSISWKESSKTYLTDSYGVATHHFDQSPPNYALNGSLMSMVKWESSSVGSALTFHHPPSTPSTVDVTGYHSVEVYGGTTDYEEALLHEGTVVQVADAPSDDDYPYLEAPIETPATDLVDYDSNSNWIFVHGGSVLIACNTVKSYTLDETRDMKGRFFVASDTKDTFSDEDPGPWQVQNLRTTAENNGVVIETADPSDYSGSDQQTVLDNFASDVKNNSSIDSSGIDNTDPTLTYTTKDGDTLTITHNGDHVINGSTVDYTSYKKFDNPWVDQAYDSATLTLSHPDKSQDRVYDFSSYEISGEGEDNVAEPSTTLELSSQGDSVVEEGDSREVTATLTNDESSSLSNVSLGMNVPSGWTSSTSDTTSWSSLGSGQSVQATFTVTADSPSSYGDFNIEATASYTFNSTSYDAPTLPPGVVTFNVPKPPIVHYPFDESSGASTASDASGNGRDATIGSGVTTGVQGIDGSAYQFDGTADATVEDADAENYLNGLDEITVSTWVKSANTGVDQGIVLGDPDAVSSTTNGYEQENLAGLGLGYSTLDTSNCIHGVVDADENTGSTSSDKRPALLRSNTGEQTTEWQHLLYTWSGGEITLYIDGAEVGTSYSRGESGLTTDIQSLVIGNGPLNETWDGKIDEVRVYDRVVRSSEIDRLSANPTDEIVHYKFDESSGASTATDSSGNGRDASIGSGVTTGVSGNVGSAFDFDGTSSATVEDTDGENYLDGQSAITVTAWVKSDSTGVNSGIFTGDPSEGDGGLGLRYDSSGWEGGASNCLKAAIQFDDGSGTITDTNLETEGGLQTTGWQHVALSWKAGEKPTVYVDGSEVDYSAEPSTTSSSATLANNSTLLVGGPMKDDTWNGKIDDFRVFDRKLSNTEISSLADK